MRLPALHGSNGKRQTNETPGPVRDDWRRPCFQHRARPLPARSAANMERGEELFIYVPRTIAC